MKVGIIKGLLYYYDEVLWMSFFENLGVKTITNKEVTKKSDYPVYIDSGANFFITTARQWAESEEAEAGAVSGEDLIDTQASSGSTSMIRVSASNLSPSRTSKYI